jgi:hypothetical protein
VLPPPSSPLAARRRPLTPRPCLTATPPGIAPRRPPTAYGGQVGAHGEIEGPRRGAGPRMGPANTACSRFWPAGRPATHPHAPPPPRPLPPLPGTQFAFVELLGSMARPSRFPVAVTGAPPARCAAPACPAPAASLPTLRLRHIHVHWERLSSLSKLDPPSPATPLLPSTPPKACTCIMSVLYAALGAFGYLSCGSAASEILVFSFKDGPAARAAGACVLLQALAQCGCPRAGAACHTRARLSPASPTFPGATCSLTLCAPHASGFLLPAPPH